MEESWATDGKLKESPGPDSTWEQQGTVEPEVKVGYAMPELFNAISQYVPFCV